MRKNNKGYMLVEVIVTSTIILTAMIGLYCNFNKLYQRYNTKNNYYSIDGLYATKEMTNHLLNSDFNKFLNDNMNKTSIIYLIKNGECNSSEIAQINSGFCSSLKSLYHIKNMIFVEYDACSLIFDNDHNNKYSCNLSGDKYLQVTNETFKDYIDYVMEYYSMYNASIKEDTETTADKYSYLILTELEDGENNYYSNIRMR